MAKLAANGHGVQVDPDDPRERAQGNLRRSVLRLTMSCLAVSLMLLPSIKSRIAARHCILARGLPPAII